MVLTCVLPPAQCTVEDLSSHILTQACTLQGSLLLDFQEAELCHITLLISKVLDQVPSSIQGKSMLSGKAWQVKPGRAVARNLLLHEWEGEEQGRGAEQILS